MRLLITTLGTLLAGATPFAARAAFPDAEAATTAHDLRARAAVAGALATQDRPEADEAARLRRALEELRAQKAELQAQIEAERARIAAGETPDPPPVPEVPDAPDAPAPRQPVDPLHVEQERIEQRAARVAEEREQRRAAAESRALDARAELERAERELRVQVEALMSARRRMAETESTLAAERELLGIRAQVERLHADLAAQEERNERERAERSFGLSFDAEPEVIDLVLDELDVAPEELDLERQREIEVLLQRLDAGDMKDAQRWIEVHAESGVETGETREVIVEKDGERRRVFLAPRDEARSGVLLFPEFVSDEGVRVREVRIGESPQSLPESDRSSRARFRVLPEPPRASEAPRPVDESEQRRERSERTQEDGATIPVFESEDGTQHRFHEVDPVRPGRAPGSGSSHGVGRAPQAPRANDAPDRDALLREVHALTSEMLGELRELRSAVDELRREVRPRGDR